MSFFLVKFILFKNKLIIHSGISESTRCSKSLVNWKLNSHPEMDLVHVIKNRKKLKPENIRPGEGSIGKIKSIALMPASGAGTKI